MGVHTCIYIVECMFVCTHTNKTWYGFLLPLTVCLSSINNKKAPVKYRTSLEHSISVELQTGNTYTTAHRHNTRGFGTPMLVLLLSIFQHRRIAGYKTGQTHSCLRLPPPEDGRNRLSDRKKRSAVTFNQHRAVYFWSSSLSSNKQLQAVIIGGILRGAGGQEGSCHRGPRCCGDIEEGVSADAGGCWIAEGRGRSDTGQVDAEC